MAQKDVDPSYRDIPESLYYKHNLSFCVSRRKEHVMLRR
jgi:hypothetical protein